MFHCALVVSERWFHLQYFSPDQFLVSLVERRVSFVDHVDPVGGLLESHGSIFVAIFIILFIFLLFVFFQLTLLERLAKVNALEDRVFSFRM